MRDALLAEVKRRGGDPSCWASRALNTPGWLERMNTFREGMASPRGEYPLGSVVYEVTADAPLERKTYTLEEILAEL